MTVELNLALYLHRVLGELTLECQGVKHRHELLLRLDVSGAAIFDSFLI